MDINFLPPQKEQKKQEPSARGFLLLLLVTTIVLLAFGGVVIMTRVVRRGGAPLFIGLARLLRSGDIVLTGERENRVNVLLIGVGGTGHEGGTLADTILLASLEPKSGASALVSIPRDLAVPFPSGEWRKINAVSAFAESIAPRTGGEALRTLLAELLDIPIPYYVRVDFKGFSELIDAVGGITVDVENRLEDRRYPIPGNEYRYPVAERYEHLVIEKGVHHMDGAMALKYARSRRGEGIEGSDFARTRRQQKIILALKEKMLSRATLLHPSRLQRISAALADNITTNITLREAMRFAEIAKNIDRERIHQVTLSDAPESFLRARIIDGAYILEPRDGNFLTLQTLVKNILVAPPVAPPPPQKKIRLALLNGTTVNGLARTIGEILKTQDFTISYVGNAPVKPVEKTLIYDLTDGREFLAYDRLRLLLDAVPPETGMRITIPLNDISPSDFIIVLGANTKKP